MASEFTVREMTAADAPGAAKANVDAWEAAYRGRMPDVILDGHGVDELARRIAERPRPLPPRRSDLVVVHGSEVIGLGGVGPGRDEEFSHLGELAYINIHPTWWGTGAGPLLHDALCSKLAEFGYEEVYLWVLADNPRAHRFYARNGWCPTEHVKDDTKWGPPVREVQLRRQLT